MQLNGEYLIAVTPQDPKQPVAFTVQAREETRPHILYDLRHGTGQVYASGTVRVMTVLAQGTVYRLVPASDQCVRDAEAGDVVDEVNIRGVAVILECRSYLPVVDIP